MCCVQIGLRTRASAEQLQSHLHSSFSALFISPTPTHLHHSSYSRLVLFSFCLSLPPRSFGPQYRDPAADPVLFCCRCRHHADAQLGADADAGADASTSTSRRENSNQRSTAQRSTVQYRIQPAAAQSNRGRIGGRVSWQGSAGSATDDSRRTHRITQPVLRRGWSRATPHRGLHDGLHRARGIVCWLLLRVVTPALLPTSGTDGGSCSRHHQRAEAEIEVSATAARQNQYSQRRWYSRQPNTAGLLLPVVASAVKQR